MGDNEIVDNQPYASHPLRMSGRSAMYSFSFDLGSHLDLIGLANRLLKKDMATVAGSPSREQMRVGRRVSKTHSFYRKRKKSVDFFEELHSDTNELRLGKLWSIDRKFTVQIIWALRRPIFGAIIWRVLFGQKPRTKSGPQEDGLADKFSTDLREAQQNLQNSIDGIRDTFMDQLIIGGMRLRLEQQLYFPRYYLRYEPFIRLEMNRAYFSDNEFETEPIEISLMIHRSGICILTFATAIPHELDVDTAHQIVLADTRFFVEAMLSTPLISRRGLLSISPAFNYRREEEIHEGVPWVSISARPEDGSDQVSLLTIFYFYLNAIERMARRELETEWRCYTTLFQGSPLCDCVGVEAKTNHAIEYGQLLVRSLSPYPVIDEVRENLLKNRLVTTHAELWLAGGCAIHTYWLGQDIDYLADLGILEPIEFAILQYSELEAIDTRTVKIMVRDGDLFDAQNQLATGLPEYGRNLMPDLDAPRIVDALSEQLNTAQIYERLNDRVKVLESIVNTRFTRIQSRRSVAISFLSLLIVVLLLLPRIDEFLTKMATLSPTASLVQAVNGLFGNQERAIVGIYIISIMILIAIFAAFAFRPKRILRHRRKFGYPTEHDVVVNRARELGWPGDGDAPAQEHGPEASSQNES